MRKGMIYLVMLLVVASLVFAEPGTAPQNRLNANSFSALVSGNALSPMVTETGKLSLSIDGLGITGSSGIVQVEKPAGATVKAAYLASATTGFSGATLVNGDIKLEGSGASWSASVPSSILSNNYWADVTSIIKPVVDAAPAGRVNINLQEVKPTSSVDGSVLAVIFDDPSQLHDNTIILFFGAQNVAGDTFNIGLSDPIDTSKPGFALDFSLGISFGFQPAGQYSRVDVNSQRLTTSAGGQDDGADANGALVTVGGLDDSNVNPANPFATDSGGPRYDDELYSLVPFVKNGESGITVFTQNPSSDDNIFFAALFLGATAAISGEGIVLGPTDAVNPLNTEHTVTATVQDTTGAPIVGETVTFEIVEGPNAGITDTDVTDSEGKATFTYSSSSEGTDVIVASYENSQEKKISSNRVTKQWIDEPSNDVPEFSAIGAGIALAGAAGYTLFRRKK